jgi:hypothetical protein
MIAMAIFAAMITPLAASADTVNFSGSGAFGSAFIPSDSCHYIYYSSLYIFENSSKSKSVKTGNAGAYLYAEGYNNCTNNYFYAYGSVDGISFNKKSNSKTITASGSIPVYDYYSGSSDVVDFNLTFTQNTDYVNSSSGTAHNEYQYGTNVYKTNYHYDYTSSSATVTGTISGGMAGSALDGGGFKYARHSFNYALNCSQI